MLKKIRTEEPLEENSTTELDALQHTDWVKDVLIRTVDEMVVSFTHICFCDVQQCMSYGSCKNGNCVCLSFVHLDSAVGAANEGVEAGCEAQEGGGTAV